MELRSTCLTILRSVCLTIRPGLSSTSFLESTVTGKASDLKVWSCSLSNATQKRERELWVSEKRELWVKEKKMKKEKRQRRTGKETLLDGTSHTGGFHSLLNFIKMPLKLNSQKLKTPMWCFLFPSL